MERLPRTVQCGKLNQTGYDEQEQEWLRNKKKMQETK